MISAVIITYNEEEAIVDCVLSLIDIVDEIVIVDAESSDTTVDRALNASGLVKTYSKKWSGYGAARNYGCQMASNEWILTIDADERYHGLMKNVITRISLDPQLIYCFLRFNFYKKKKMHHGFLRPEWKPRLYNKSFAKWNNRKVHEELIHNKSIKLHRIINAQLMHYAYKDEADLNGRLGRYALLTAEQWMETSHNPHQLIKWLAPTFHFIKTYLMQLGVLEGSAGLATSKAAFNYSRSKYKYFDQLSVPVNQDGSRQS